MSVRGADPAKFDGIWTSSSGGSFWLYNDSSHSRIDYFDRLGWLMSQKVRLVGKVVRREAA
jgi:hypothetical protein